MPNTVFQLETRVKNRVRRTPAELLTELRNIVNEAQDQICQRKKYWFLDLPVTFTITVGVGSWWDQSLPALFDSPVEAWEIVLPNRLPLEFITPERGITQYDVPNSTTASRGQIEGYGPSPDDYTMVRFYPVPIVNTSVYMKYRAESLPDLVNDGDHNVLTDSYIEVIETWAVALSWYFLGENIRGDRKKAEAQDLARTTIDRENQRKEWAAINSLPLREDVLSVPTTGRETGRRRGFIEWWR